MKLSYIILLSALLGACAHGPNTAREEAQTQAFKELREYQQESRRSPSSVERPRELVDIERGLNTLKSYEYLVFPKLVDIAEKNDESVVDFKAVAKMSDDKKREYFDSLADYASPRTYFFSVQRNLSCQALRKEKGKFSADKFFSDFKGEKSTHCLIVRGQQKDPEIKKGNIRRDDLLEVQLYFDEDLKPYGQVNSLADGKRVNFQTGAGIRSVGIKLMPIDHLSSELFLLPIDYPNFNGARQDVNRNWTYDSNALSIPKDKYVESKIAKLGKHKLCQAGYKTEYKTNLGKIVRIGWCKGDALPTTIQTETYFAVLKRISN